MTGPASTIIATWKPPSEVNVPCPVTCREITNASAIGPTTSPSPVRLAVAGNATFFLSSPYTPNDTASASPSHGGLPLPTLITTTASAAMPSAATCARFGRSRSTTTPSSTLTSGLM
ncbi:hypothetical protein GCM10023215_66840 [Pseudonocardia yuanmonensis]|uniref:Uncharacterized protein n=1 Tax=Pseudonocardia yuanmonensis TaxID=1095914 RepID=A0ABP8XUJ3_9PSEU